MKILSRLVLLSILLALLAVPVMGQEGEGGVAVYGSFGSGPDTFSPIYCTDTACRDVITYLYVGLLGVDPETQQVQAGLPGALAESVEVEVVDGNNVFTVHLRDDMYWTDGTPITIDDVLYAWEVVITPEAEYPYAYIADEYIQDLVALDDSTLQITGYGASCEAMIDIALDVYPSHIFSQYEFADLATIDYNQNPDVTSGPFQLGEHRPAEITTLVGWDDYVDASMGYINIDGLVQLVVADQTVAIEEFLAPSGQLTWVEGPPPDRKADIRAAGEAGTHQVYTFTPGDSWDYMAFNMADPTNPQPGVDEDGNFIDQGYHPMFSDKMVRQAISHAVDVDSIIEGAVFGEGSRMASNVPPGVWFHNDDLAPRAFDTELALSMLAEAGWTDEDGDGVLECHGCLYATEVDPEFEGTPFEFELLTNAGNTRREAIGTIIQDQLAQIGITVDFQTIEFNTLIDIMYGQTYDAYILGWRAGYPPRASNIQLWSAESDAPEAYGSNVTSFFNEEFRELDQQALRLPGCDPEERAAIYHRLQEIMADETPYLWLYVQDGMYAARSNLGGFDPYPRNIDWNIDVWYVSEQ